MQPAEGPINVDDHHGIGYHDFEPLDIIEIPLTLTGATPALLGDIYDDFRNWLGGLPNIRTHLGNTVEEMEEFLLCSQLDALRLSVMSQFFMRHPSAEVHNRS